MGTGSRVRLWRLPFLAGAMALLVAGLWGGLARIGWAMPGPGLELGLLHGPIMIAGFLGTLIGLERAVALDRIWGYGAPVGALLGTVGVLAGLHGPGAALVLAGALVLVATFVSFLRRQREVFLGVMAAGAVSWAVGTAVWFAGAPLWEVVPWWSGFLVLTIAGERLELSRIRMSGARPQREFLAVAGLYATGPMTGTFAPGIGARLTGLGLAAIGVWLLVRDVARSNARRSGLPRFLGVVLLSGYVWLPVSGLIFLWEGALRAGPIYDAALHGVFVGFVMAMIFAHAPIIFPSVLGVPLVFGRYLYGPLLLLHAGTIVRLWGDLSGGLALRRWGALVSAAAIVGYLLLLVGGTVWDGLATGETDRGAEHTSS